MRLALGQLLASRKNSAGALAVLAETPADQAQGAGVLRTRAVLKLATDQPAPTLGTFEQLIEAAPNAAEPRYLMVIARTAGGAQGAEEDR